MKNSINESDNPLNIALLVPKPNMFNSIPEVKSRDVFEQNSTEFNLDGLFSTSIFGLVGSQERMTNFGYINTGVKILHPRIYAEVTSLSTLYKGILNGSKYATFNEKTKDFELSNENDGKTGFKFFFKHYNDIIFKETDSLQRKFSIEFIKKYTLEESIITKYLVLPAGLRDYMITESGKPLENEINAFYRKLISTATTAKQFNADTNDSEIINQVQFRVQRVANEIYEYLQNILDGKGGYIQGKWAKRTIMYGTRNVLTSIPEDIHDVEDKLRPDALTSIIGLFESMKGLLDITIFNVRTKLLHDIFDLESNKALLIDKKTFKRDYKTIGEKTRSKWITDEGLEDIINKMYNDDLKNSIIDIDGNYLLLIYDDDKEVIVIKDIENLPETYNRKYIKPITYGELFFLAIFNEVEKYPGYVTRYPITGLGSINPSKSYLKSTLKSKRVKITIPGICKETECSEYPIIGTSWLSSLAVPNIYLGPMGADFDGCNNNFTIKYKNT